MCLLNMYRICLFQKVGKQRSTSLSVYSSYHRNREVFLPLGSRKSRFTKEIFLCYRSTCTSAADLPGIPAICFRIVFVCGDEFNLSLSEICKCFLMNTLNVQLEAEKKHFKNEQNNEKPNHPNWPPLPSSVREQIYGLSNCNLSPRDSPQTSHKPPLRSYTSNKDENSTHQRSVFQIVRIQIGTALLAIPYREHLTN